MSHRDRTLVRRRHPTETMGETSTARAGADPDTTGAGNTPAPVVGVAGTAVTRAEIVRTALTSVAAVVGLFLIYAVIPLSGHTDVRGVVLLLLGLLLFTASLTRQVRAILRSHSPMLRAIQGLAVAIPLFLLPFAAAYVAMSNADRGTFSQPLNRIDAFYFVVTVFATVGFGDITPVTEVARVIVTVQMICDLILLGAVLKIVLGAVKISQTRQKSAGATASTASTVAPVEASPTAPAARTPADDATHD